MSDALAAARINLCRARLALNFAPTEFDRHVAKMHLRHAIKAVEATLPAKSTGMFFRKQI